VAIASLERLEPWAVARVHLAGETGDYPSSVIVKWLRENAQHVRTDASQLATERASLEFLDRLDLGVAPRVLAADDQAAFLVLEDLAPRVALFDLLAVGHEQALPELHAFADTMATLHAATVRDADRYYEHRQSYGRADPRRDRLCVYGFEWRWSLPDLRVVGIDNHNDVHAEMQVVRDTLVADGPFVALSNGDAGANNFFVENADGRIIDWEFAAYRNACLDAACLFVPGPMWMTVADPFVIGIDVTYRARLAAGLPAADDDERFGLAMAAACLVHGIVRLDRLAKLDARPQGHESRQQMIATLEAAVRAAVHFAALPRLAEWTADAAAALRRRWPDADRTFPDAYTTRE
jgi:hypothetical protein